MNSNNGPAQSTVDSKQIQYYSSFADRWWNPKFAFMLLRSMNSLRVPFIRDGLIARKRENSSFVDKQSPLKGIKILDVGCGGGFLCEALACLGAEVTGIDASHDLIAVAKTHAQLDPTLKENLTYIKITAEEHVLDHRDYYDAVVASEVIEHVSDQTLFVEKCVELAKPGGSVFMTAPTKRYIAWVMAKIIGENLLNLYPIGTLDYDLFITPEALQKLFEKNGCQKNLVQGMMYFPYLDKWCWVPSVILSYAIHVVKNPL